MVLNFLLLQFSIVLRCLRQLGSCPASKLCKNGGGVARAVAYDLCHKAFDQKWVRVNPLMATQQVATVLSHLQFFCFFRVKPCNMAETWRVSQRTMWPTDPTDHSAMLKAFVQEWFVLFLMATQLTKTFLGLQVSATAHDRDY